MKGKSENVVISSIADATRKNILDKSSGELMDLLRRDSIKELLASICRETKKGCQKLDQTRNKC